MVIMSRAFSTNLLGDEGGAAQLHLGAVSEHPQERYAGAIDEGHIGEIDGDGRVGFAI
jgi:hypothetical protein